MQAPKETMESRLRKDASIPRTTCLVTFLEDGSWDRKGEVTILGDAKPGLVVTPSICPELWIRAHAGSMPLACVVKVISIIDGVTRI